MEEADRLIDDYLEAFLEANKSINLTSIDDREQASLLHVEDSLAGLEEVLAAPEGRYGDLGSGGGFPGVPIALSSGRQTVLVDSVKKKMRVVQGIIEQLGLQGQIETYPGRIEELAQQEPASFAVLTARALSSLPSLVELASPLLIKGGLLVCYKAHVSGDELAAACKAAPQVGMSQPRMRSLLLSDGETARTIVTFVKEGEPRLRLPRRIGMAQKSPLA